MRSRRGGRPFQGVNELAKAKIAYQCAACGATLAKWSGQCPDCEQWNCVTEAIAPAGGATSTGRGARTRWGGESGGSRVLTLDDVDVSPESRSATGIAELDRVLGGGLVPGSVILIGGDPGIGKSTLLLQVASRIAQDSTQGGAPLYVTGEESLRQVGLRARRLGIDSGGLRLLAETEVERVMDIAASQRPAVLVMDSIQAVYSSELQSAPGSVAQVRESAAKLTRFAKDSGTVLFLVGHVTKEGALAGPRVLEHMVDTVLYFESEGDQRFRVIRAVKNRYGAANELGIFAMTDAGLREVANPSAIFLSRGEEQVPGSVVMVTREGTRPMLLEIQALVDDSHLGNPRRVAVGLDSGRLAMLLAVMHRHAGSATHDQDVFVNVVGGVRVSETAADLPLLMSVWSSLRDKPLPRDLVVFGEVGLSGEVRPVYNGEERLNEAAKHGFRRAIVPKGNLRGKRAGSSKLEITGVSRLEEALAALKSE